MNKTIKTLLPVLGFASFASCAEKAQQPNVLLILTDDQGWGDVGANGNRLINTPTLDRLYSESVVMNHFFVSPLSAPTRASLLTGRYHLRTGVTSVSSGLENMNPEETTLAELFKDAGYATGCFGKWHNGAYYPYSPLGQGFDTFLGFCCGHWPTYFDPPLQKDEEMFRGKGYITDIFTDAAINFIEKNRDKPFFCYVPYNAPHSPFQVPDNYYNKYANIEAANADDQKKLASIYAMVECVDANIARLLSKLDQLGIRENTIVIFMTDNGPTHVVRYNGEMRGVKGTVHEGGVRVPCWINWKGKLKHAVIEGLAAHIDILPTLMDLCGISKYHTNFPVDGISLKENILKGTDIPSGRSIFTHRLAAELFPWMGAVRTENQRLTIYPDNKPYLFDMTQDPSEKNDIFDASNPAHQALYDSYQRWFESASKGVALNTNIPVGYSQAPQVRIPTPEGKMFGHLKCYGFPNQNWVRHFQHKADSLTYTIDVVAPGSYEILLEFNHKGYNPQSTAFAFCNQQTLSIPVPEFISEFYPNNTRFDMGEAPEKTWGRLSLGYVELTKGLHSLTIWAEGIPDDQTMEVKTVIINKKTQ